MAHTYQQRSAQQKLIYFAVIVVLFTLTLLVRGKWRFPLTHAASLESQAAQLQLRESDLGEVELTSSAVRLFLTGSRGIVICALWHTAIEKQKKHEWNELELLVTSITKIQPHFVTPWLFQSWNLAYNVAAESDRVKDKYFYISRGLELLAEGEQRISTHPDMRLSMGTYYQSKFGLSDEASTLRSLLQLSCIDPVERDPQRFRANRQSPVNLEQFEAFCQAYPFLVRRLRETPGKKKEEVLAKTVPAVIDFLEDHQRIPSRFQEASFTEGQVQRSTPLKRSPLERFPILPPTVPMEPFREDAFTNDMSKLDPEFDNYSAARAWFSYAQDPFNFKRRPRYMAALIFMGYPARAQANQAEWLQKEGWFDEPWEITEWFPDKTVAVGGARIKNLVKDMWEKAYHMYYRHGRDHKLEVTPEAFLDMTADERSMYDNNRSMTNFAHFLRTTNVERTQEAVSGRKCFFKADRARKIGSRNEAIRWYQHADALGEPQTWWDKSKTTGWKKLLLNNPDYAADGEIQEYTYDVELKYLGLIEDLWVTLFSVKELLVLQDYLGKATAPGTPGMKWQPSPYLHKKQRVQFRSPFDDDDQYGKPILNYPLLARIFEGRQQQDKK